MTRNYIINKTSDTHFVLKIIFVVCFCFVLCLSLFSEEIVSIYDIQFTTNPGFDGTFPSPMINQSVVIQGVVTAASFENNRIYVSETQGGAWSAIAVEGVKSRVSLGDFIQVQGKVSEIMGLTVLTQAQNVRVLSKNTPIPNPISITAYDALTMEAYESVLVRISNLTCRRLLNGTFLAIVEDETASLHVGNSLNNNSIKDFFSIGNNYSHIIGIVVFSHNRFSIHPRHVNDVGSVQTGVQSSSWGRIKSLYR